MRIFKKQMLITKKLFPHKLTIFSAPNPTKKILREIPSACRGLKRAQHPSSPQKVLGSRYQEMTLNDVRIARF